MSSWTTASYTRGGCHQKHAVTSPAQFTFTLKMMVCPQWEGLFIHSIFFNFLARVVSSDAGVPVTELSASYNRYINHERNLVERVFADVKKYPWFQSHAAGGRQYDYDFITKMFIFSCHIHNLGVRWRGR